MLKSWPVLLIVLSFLTLGGHAFAASGSADSGTSAPSEDAFIRLTPDTTKIIKLDQDAASVIVTNPAHARVLLDTPRVMLVMPRTPGTTPVTVLNAKGEPILEKTIIVSAAAKPQYVRIRRMCGQAGSGGDCVPTSYFYCPDGCYEVTTVDPAGDAAAIPPQQGGSPAYTEPETNNEEPAPQEPQ